MALPSSVKVREVGPREGLQIHSEVVPTAKKLELIKALAAAGLSEIEVASFVKPERIPQMADAEALVRSLEPAAGVVYRGLYLNQAGFKRACALSQLDVQGWLSIAVSNTFLKKNMNSSIDLETSRITEWLETFAAAGKKLHGLMVSTAFGCNDEGLFTPQQAFGVVRAFIQAVSQRGAKFSEVCLADTMGWGVPTQVQSLVELVRACYPEVTVSLHLHDTRGMGIANVYAGMLAGVDIFDCSVGGMGGCPFTTAAAGNVATEEVLHLCEKMGVSTGVNLEKCLEAARVTEVILGTELRGKLYRAWRASALSSRTSGVKKNDLEKRVKDS